MSAVDGNELFARARMTAQFARLSSELESSTREVERNPWPYIQTLHEEVLRLRSVLHSVECALQPAPQEVEGAGAVPLSSVDIAETAVLRVSDALHLLRTIKDPKPKKEVHHE